MISHPYQRARMRSDFRSGLCWPRSWPHLLVFLAKVPMFGMMIAVGTAQKIGLFVLFAALEVAGVVFLVREHRRARAAGEIPEPVQVDLRNVFRR